MRMSFSKAVINWQQGDPVPDEDLTIPNEFGITPAHILAYRGYEFADTAILQLTDNFGRTVESEYQRGVKDREAAKNAEVLING